MSPSIRKKRAERKHIFLEQKKERKHSEKTEQTKNYIQQPRKTSPVSEVAIQKDHLVTSDIEPSKPPVTALAAEIVIKPLH